MYIMKVKPEYFDKIKNGKKLYEIRLLDDKRKLLKVGDSVLLKKEPDMFDGIVIRITEIKHFNTFLEMAQRLSIKDIGFEGKTAAEVNDIYHQIYKVEDEVRYGVVALKFDVL